MSVWHTKAHLDVLLWQRLKWIKSIQEDTLVNVAQALVCSSQKCLDADGNDFEHLL